MKNMEKKKGMCEKMSGRCGGFVEKNRKIGEK
jgi:hypothetical protein